jgi:hypothetical protein
MCGREDIFVVVESVIALQVAIDRASFTEPGTVKCVL